MLEKNIIANYLGQFWTVLMGIIFIPIYISLLGLSSFGLIGLFTLLSTILGLLDLGLKSTLSREMARFTGGERSAQSTGELLRSIEIIIFIIAVLITFFIFLLSDLIALSWPDSADLSIETVSSSISIMGLVVALRLMQYIYASSINGLQRQVLLNKVLIFIETLRGFGTVFILVFISPTIYAFFIWQAAVTLLAVLILCLFTYRILPKFREKLNYSQETLMGIWSYSKGVLGITALALLLSQADKILLIKLLTLSEYGLYAFTAIVANIVLFSISPITNAFFPIFSEKVALNKEKSINDYYHFSAQLVSVFAGSIALVLATFSREFLEVWTQDPKLSSQASNLLTLLVVGNLLNGLMWIPYQLQLAYGWTSLSLKVNMSALFIIIPCLIYFVPIYGAIAAAWVWVLLNVGCILIPIHIIHRRLLIGEKWNWIINDNLKPLMAGTLVVFLLYYIAPETESLIFKAIYLLFVSCSVLFVSLIFASQIRKRALGYLKRMYQGN